MLYEAGETGSVRWPFPQIEERLDLHFTSM